MPAGLVIQPRTSRLFCFRKCLFNRHLLERCRRKSDISQDVPELLSSSHRNSASILQGLLNRHLCEVIGTKRNAAKHIPEAFSSCALELCEIQCGQFSLAIYLRSPRVGRFTYTRGGLEAPLELQNVSTNELVELLDIEFCIELEFDLT